MPPSAVGEEFLLQEGGPSEKFPSQRSVANFLETSEWKYLWKIRHQQKLALTMSSLFRGPRGTYMPKTVEKDGSWSRCANIWDYTQGVWVNDIIDLDDDMRYITDWCKIVKLDCLDRPGLRAKEFYGLFVQCDVCEIVMTHQVFSKHHCRPLGEDGLELTEEELTDQE